MSRESVQSQLGESGTQDAQTSKANVQQSQQQQMIGKRKQINHSTSSHNELEMQGAGVTEQFSVNVTITKVGNTMFQSRVDISKQTLPDQKNWGEEPSPKTSEITHRIKKATIVEPQEIMDNVQENQISEHSQQQEQNKFNQILYYDDGLVGGPDELGEIYTLEKFKKFDERSLFIFKVQWRFRQIIITFIRWKLYDQIMILSILGNSICLALTDYKDDDNLTQWNKTLDTIDQVFTVIYTSEAVLKIVAFGFILHSKSYMRDPWNVLDFVVVIIGLISLIPSVPNLKSLRTMRILRPLRSINAVPSMKRLVATLLMSLPQMGYLVSFVLFFITVFAILGMQLFARDLYFRCRITDQPIENATKWIIDINQTRLCGGNYQCLPNTYCHSLYEQSIPLEVDQVDTWEFIQYGYFHFDNLGISILSIFRVITLEGWTTVMYNYLDSSGFIATLYFPLLVIIGSFFLLNLFLAVIMQTFSDMNKKQQAADDLKRHLSMRKSLREAEMLESGQKGNIDAKTNERISKMVRMNTMKYGDKSNAKFGIAEAALILLAQIRQQKANQKLLDKKVNTNIVRQKTKFITPIEIQCDESIEDQKQEQASEDRFILGLKKFGEERLRSSINVSEQDDDTIKNDVDSIVVKDHVVPSLDLDVVEQNVKYQEEQDIKKPRTILNKIQYYFLVLCESLPFTAVINLSIVINTICLGLDSYPVDIELQSKLDTVNIVFFALFFIEMLIKIAGMGPRQYVRDLYNIFDAFVVILSVIDVSFSAAVPNSDQNFGKGAISAFRAFRLLRVFKLAKTWTKLKQLIQTIVKSLKDISSFSVLLFLLMFIYILLGMEIFSDKTTIVVQKTPNPKSRKGNQIGRANFDNFFSGFIVIFIVLTGEGWDQTMFQFARTNGYVSIIFFVSLIVIGVMIFLNLFLAILLENFDNDDLEEEVDATPAIEGEIKKGIFHKIKERICTQFVNIKALCARLTLCIPVRKSPKIASIVNDQKDDSRHLDSDRNMMGGSRHNITAANSMIKIEPLSPGDKSMNEVDYLKVLEKSQSLQDIFPGKAVSSMELQLPASKKRTTLLLPIDEIDELKPIEQSPSHAVRFMRLNNTNQQSTQFGGLNEEQPNINQTSSLSQDFENNLELRHLSKSEPFRIDSNGDLKQLQIKDGFVGSPENINRSLKINSPQSNKFSNSKSLTIVMMEKAQKQTATKTLLLSQAYICEGNSLLFLKSNNKFRMMTARLVKSHYFEMFIIVLIIVSSILLALDNPLNDPESALVMFLQYSDIILTVFFVSETIAKIIVYGFLFNKENSYLRNGWNIIDFIVVIVSIISQVITSNELRIVKILRLLRVLRPLRVISRNKGLKIGIQALFMAVPSLLNVIIVSMLFFVIFGIIGVNYFKGTFFSCKMSDFILYQLSFSSIESVVTTKYDCINKGGEWVNADQHFDSVPESMSTLFQMTTTEGWVDIMNRGIDSVAIDMHPIRNNNIAIAFFFMIFLLLGNFLILNLFVGVVVSTFNKEKEILGKNFLLTDKQKQWIAQKNLVMSIEPKVLIASHDNKFRQFFLNIVESKNFEIFILTCIVLNTLVLAFNWYSQPVYIDDILDKVNYSFAFMFALEAIAKLIAIGPSLYYRELGNCFDFFIVITSIVSSVVSEMLQVDFGASTTFIRALRIARIFKFVRKSKQIKVIFETIIVTLPALTNIGGLLLLFLYIFSVLGVFLFAETKLQNALSIHSNFQSFGVAFLTLFRSATGEDWNSIMMDLLRQESILFQCSNESFDYSRYRDNGWQTDGCGSISGIVFYMCYFLMVPLIFLNLFIAIILEGFEQTSQKVNNLISEEDLERFRDCWAQFDNNGTGFIKITKLPELMLMLGEPLGWNEDIYKEQQSLQDDFMEDLNIQTYNGFKDYLFWDVIQALTKIHMVSLTLKKKISVENDTIHTNSSYAFSESESFLDDEEAGENGLIMNPIKVQKQQLIKRQDSLNKAMKLELRLELEFENFDDERQEVMEVEEVKRKETRVRRSYLSQRDNMYTSAHIKAARTIMVALRRVKEIRIKKIHEDAVAKGFLKRTGKSRVINSRLKFSRESQNSADPNHSFDHPAVESPLRLKVDEEPKSPANNFYHSRTNAHLLEDQTARENDDDFEEEEKTMNPDMLAQVVQGIKHFRQGSTDQILNSHRNPMEEQEEDSNSFEQNPIDQSSLKPQQKNHQVSQIKRPSSLQQNITDKNDLRMKRQLSSQTPKLVSK